VSKEMRSRLHIEANNTDREMHRVAMMMDRLVGELTPDDGERLRKAARALSAARSTVRHYMHRDDRRATE